MRLGPRRRVRPSDANRKELAEAERLVADGPDKPFFDVHFHDENNGVVVGAYGLAFATQDGGKRWLPWSDRIPNPQGRHLYSIHTSGNTWFIAGEQGALFRSADGGSSFVSVKTPYTGTYFGALGGAQRRARRVRAARQRLLVGRRRRQLAEGRRR